MRFTNDQYDIEAWIEYLNNPGSRLPEHQTEQKPAEHTRDGFQYCKGYLEMIEGQRFRIAVKVHRPIRRENAFEIRLFVDGRDFLTQLFESNRYGGTNTYYRSEVYVVKNGQQTIGDLTFSRLNMTDDAEKIDVFGEALGNLCSVVLRIRAGVSRCHWGSSKTGWNSNPDVGKVFEKHIKMGSTVTATNMRPFISHGHHHEHIFDPLPFNAQVCSFVWKYYTRDMLVIKGIVGEFQHTRTIASQDVKPDMSPASNKRKHVRSTRTHRGADHEQESSDSEDQGVTGPGDEDVDDGSDGDGPPSGRARRAKRVKVVEVLDITGNSEAEDE